MKRKINLLVTLIFTIMLSIAFGLTIVNAETIAKNVTIKSTNYKNPPMSFPQTFHVKKTTKGKYAYCITYAKKTPSSGIKYVKDDIVDEKGKYYILKEAYKNVKNNNDFFIYQTALWIYMSDKGIMNKSYSVSTFRSKVYNSNSATAKKIRNIVANAKKAPKIDTSAPTIKLTVNNNKMSLEGSNYVSKKIKLKSSTDSYKISFSGAPAKTTYKVSKGYLYVYVPKSSVKSLNVSFKVNASNSKTIYKSQNYKPNNGSYQKMALPYKETKTDSTSLKLVINKTVEVPVNKVDSATNNYVQGATLEVKNSSGATIDKWTTTTTSHVIKNLTQGTYTISEVSAPAGYNLNTQKIVFTVDNNGVVKTNGNTVSSIKFTNTKSLRVLKVDAETKEAISGATLQITNSSGKVVDSWVTDGKEHIISSLPQGNYTLSETAAKEGYILSNEKIEFNIDASGNVKDNAGQNIIKLEFSNTKTSVQISKQDITDQKELPGATLELRNSKKEVIEKWVSEDEAHIIEGLKADTYTLTETIAPTGYKLSKETITFTLKEDGTLTDKEGNPIDKVIMYNQKETNNPKIEISKQDINTKKELPGASLSLINEENTIIDTWISGEETHIIEDIEPGTYTLTETKAPNGYILNEEKITFTVDEKGNITDESGKPIDKVVMYNQPEAKQVIISKQDITTGKELPGATLEVKDSKGTIIDTWVSTEESHIIKNLESGTYTLTEKIAPEGYILSEETITFTIDNAGKLTDESGNVMSKIVMLNKPIPKTNVTISKQDITTGKELPGATLEVKDSKGTVIDTWVSTNESHQIEGLTEGTYTLTEKIAPEGYILSEETITFTIDSTGQLLNQKGEQIDKVIMYNEKQITLPKVPIIKKDSQTNEILAGATLEIKDKDGKTIDTWVSSKEAHYVELSEGTYSLIETKAPQGYILNPTPIKFNVTSDGKLTDSNGKAINTVQFDNTKEKITTKVSISKQDITNGKELPGAKLVIKDKNGNVIDSWTSTDKPHVITDLKPGEYTLNEIVAPNGYILSNETITFTVKEDGTTTNVVMYNSPKTTPPTTTTPQQPTTPGQEIKVENTSSWKSSVPTFIGGLSMLIGTVTITKNKKKRIFN